MVIVPAPATEAMPAMALLCTFPLVGLKESRYDLQGHRWCEACVDGRAAQAYRLTHRDYASADQTPDALDSREERTEVRRMRPGMEGERMVVSRRVWLAGSMAVGVMLGCWGQTGKAQTPKAMVTVYKSPS
jgi:hypothetical protein